MSYKRVVGIDFGTSTSVVKVKTYDENDKPVGQELYSQSVTFNNGASAVIPTIVRRFGDSSSYNYSFGFDAEIPIRNSEIFRGFKVDLQSENIEESEQAKQLTQKFFEYLHSQYEHQRSTGYLGNVDDTDLTIVSYPVKWETSTRDFMLETAKSAGFENVIGMDEAEAAIGAISVQCKDVLKKNGFLFDGQPSTIMLIDMGAGTTDIVICKHTPGEQSNNEILTTWPKGGDVLFGGQEMDIVLKNYIISKFPIEYQELVKNKISIDKFKAWKENNVSPAMKNNDIVHECSDADYLAGFYDICLEDINLDRNKFEDLFFDYITKFVGLVGGAIIDSGLNPEDIDLIVLTGGHSRWYFIEDILSGKNLKFGNLNLQKIFSQPERILSVALPQETVALGMVYSKLSGSVAFNKAEHLWKTYLETKSISALEEAVDLGYAEAQNELAFLYCTGNGLSQNIDEAIRLYNLSAENGYERAFYNLGCYYFDLKDYENAVGNFMAAIEKDVPEAYNNLAVCYEYGLGIEKDQDEALNLFKKSYELGFVNAKKNYYRLYKIKYPDQQSEDLDGYNQDDVIGYAGYIINNQLTNLQRSLNNQDYSFYIGPQNIPKTKLSKFMTSFPNERSEITTENMICYLDDTFFGGGKDGFLLTNNKLYWHPLWEIGQSIDVNSIANVEFSNGRLIVFQNTGVQKSIPHAGKGNDLAVFLGKIISFINNDKQI